MLAVARQPQLCTAPGSRALRRPQGLRHVSGRPQQLVVRAQGGEEGTDREMESQFEKELRRRGLDGPGGAAAGGTAQPRSPFEQSQQRSGPRPPPRFRGEPEDDTVPPQLRQSMALNSEGLEGFLPRATELLKLGGTFFLGFAPFILAVSLGFGAVYLAFGDAFVHGGSPSSGPPPYIDPDVLLAEQTADPMIPFDLR